MEAQTLSPPAVAGSTADWHRIFETLPDEHDYVVDEVEGRLPAELVGTLYRNGPARTRSAASPTPTCSTATGCCRSSRSTDGGIRYRNRFVRTNHYLAERAADKPVMRGYGQQRPGGPLRATPSGRPPTSRTRQRSVPRGQPARAVRGRPAVAARSGHAGDDRRVRLRRRAEGRLHVLRPPDLGSRHRRAVQLRDPVRAADHACARTGSTARAGFITCRRSTLPFATLNHDCALTRALHGVRDRPAGRCRCRASCSASRAWTGPFGSTRRQADTGDPRAAGRRQAPDRGVRAVLPLPHQQRLRGRLGRGARPGPVPGLRQHPPRLS